MARITKVFMKEELEPIQIGICGCDDLLYLDLPEVTLITSLLDQQQSHSHIRLTDKNTRMSIRLSLS